MNRRPAENASTSGQPNSRNSALWFRIKEAWKKRRSAAESADYVFRSYALVIGILFIVSIQVSESLARYSNFQELLPQFVASYVLLLSLVCLIMIIPTFIMMWRRRQSPIVQAVRIKIGRFLTPFFRTGFVVLYAVLGLLGLLQLAKVSTYLTDVGVGVWVFGVVSLGMVLVPGGTIYLFTVDKWRWRRLIAKPFSDVFSILANFEVYPALDSPRYSFLLAEAFTQTRRVLSKGFPYLDASGIEETFVDAQIAMRLGTDEEKDAIVEFFAGIERIPLKTKDVKDASAFLLEGLYRLRCRIGPSDNLRSSTNLSGLWHRSWVDLLEQHEGLIMIALTTTSVFLAALLLYYR